MKLTAGVHINDGPTFNKLAEVDVKSAPIVDQSADGQPIRAVRSLDIVRVLAEALKQAAETAGCIATVNVFKAEGVEKE